MNDSKNIRNYSAEDIRRYWNNEMSPKEMHDLEIAAMDDPFLADALEGYSKLEKDPAEDLAILRNRIASKTSGAAVVPMKRKNNWWKVAAVLILLTGLGLLTAKLIPDRENSIAQTEVVKDSSPPVAPQSIPSVVDSNAQEVSQNNSASIAGKEKQVKVTFAKPEKKAYGNGGFASRSKSDTISSGLISKSEVAEESRKVSAPVSAGKAPTADITRNVDDSTAYRDNKEKNVAPAQGMQQVRLYNNFSGKVVDGQNRSIPSATVRMNNANQITATDQYGFFQFKSMDTIAEISIASTGFEERYLTLNSNQSGLITLDRSISKSKKTEPFNKAAARKDSEGPSELKVYVMEAEPVIGWDKYNQYIDSNKRFPANEPRISGEVVLSFKVNQKGELSSFDIEKSLGKSYDTEAIRLIKDGPKWRVTKGKKTKVKLIVRF